MNYLIEKCARLLIVCLLGFSSVGAVARSASLPERPNIIVILCDDLEYGNQVEERPSLLWHYFNAFGKAKVAMRSGKWKITRSAKLTHCELFDFSTDILESKDLSARRPARIDALSCQPIRLSKGTQQEAPFWQD